MSEETVIEVLKVSSHSDPNKVAGAAAMSIQKAPSVELVAVGAGAVNQTVKSIIVTKSYLVAKGITFDTDMSFITVNIDSKDKTAIKFILRKH